MTKGGTFAEPARVEIPYARTLIALEPDHYDSIARSVGLIFRISREAAYQRAVDSGAGASALHRPGNAAVFMGYDFHLTEDGPRLIEVNTNAGGALLNGLHTASLCDPVALGCRCRELLPVETMEERILRTFRSEFAAVRGEELVLGRVAIADDEPAGQFLRAEFELFRDLFSRAGIEAIVCDTREIPLGGGIDLVYLRDTDFLLETERTAELRRAYLADSVVVTPSPREHHLLANKARLAIFSDEKALREFGATAAEASFLTAVVPLSIPLDELGGERAWHERKDWVFKPLSGYASRGVYRGDKISRRKLEEILASGGYLAQRRVEPAAIPVATADGPMRMKFDVRAYAYRDEVLLLGARVYQGQVTNLRTPGGGFSAICVIRR